MRFLLVAAWPPWGRGSGYFQQVRTVVDTLGRHGTIDLCLVSDVKAAEHDEVSEHFTDRTWLRVVRSRMWGPKVMLGVGSPVRYAALHPDSEALAAEWLARDYDLTWCIEQRTYEPIAHLIRSPVVLDLCDVMSSNVAYKRRIVLSHPIWSTKMRGVIRQPEWAPGAERRWRRWEEAAARSCDRVLVRSELDQSRFGGAAGVMPNTYPTPAAPAGRRGRRVTGLDIAMVGLFDYQPNLDGARWFAMEVLPIVRELEPGARFHLFGRARPAAVKQLSGRPGVIMHGYVEDLEAELAEMSVVAAPVRFGGGTRIKILEAFAHELPLVSTTIGVEGIQARDGEHLLIRDDPASFAHAVVALHRDRDLRDRLTAAARELHASRYTPDHTAWAIERELAALVGIDARESA